LSIRTTFEDDELIYASTGDGILSWHKISCCVWSHGARLRGRASLNEKYRDLKGFFVGFLGVKPVDLLMAIDELREAGNKSITSIPEMKESIWTVNSLLSAEAKHPTPQPILESRIFPVQRAGSVTLVSSGTEFFIDDREDLRRLFEIEVKFLDFTLNEVNQLQPFLRWTGLESRYVSKHVREFTSFGGEGATPVTNSDRQINNRAYSLLRLGVPKTSFAQSITCLC
jgi:hypothetical protein